jgi:hypothetical protein
VLSKPRLTIRRDMSLVNIWAACFLPTVVDDFDEEPQADTPTDIIPTVSSTATGLTASQLDNALD